VVFGSGIGPEQLVQVSAYPLPPSLAGTSARVTVNGVALTCPMVYTSARQMAAILPSNTPVGDGVLTISFGGATAAPTPIHVVSGAFGTYSVGSSGLGPGIITGVDYLVKTPAKPAKAGETVILWGTGLGPVTGDEAAGPAIGQFSGVEVFVGTKSAKIIYAGRSGCCAGLDQIAFTIPDTGASCFVPVAVRSATVTSNFVTLPLSGGGEPCVNPAPGLPAALLSRAAAGEQLNVGALAVGPVGNLQRAGFSSPQALAAQLSKLMHTHVKPADVGRLMQAYRAGDTKTVRTVMAKYPQARAVRADAMALVQAALAASQEGAFASFERLSHLEAFSPEFASNVPAVSTCMVVQNYPLNSPSKSHSLDAGATLTVNGPPGQAVMTAASPGQYQANFGSLAGSKTPSGTYTVTGRGGKDVGPFTVSLNVGNELLWTNKSSISLVERSGPLTLTWTGGPVPGHVMIGGSTGHRTFLCVEDTQKGTFTIPQFVLGALTPSQHGALFISPHPLDRQVTIPGLDLAYIMDGSADPLSLEFY
jgi:uncharacterized protein (TIGR03437 family)